MKKKILLALLASACLACGAAAAAGCNNSGESSSHHFETGWTYNPDNLNLGHWHKCEDEGCNQVSGTAPHRWDGGVTTKTATCTEEGVITYTCSDCHATKTEPIQKAAHTWGKWTVVTAPTADTEGKATRVCTVDGCTAEDTPLTIPTLEEGTFKTEVIEAATCTTDGTTKYTYTNGNDSVSFNVTVPKGHKYKAVFDKTDIMAFTAVVTCENCSDVSVEYSKGHGLIMTHEQVQPTCQKEGHSTWTGTLTHDGVTFTDFKTNIIEKVEHSFTKWAYDETKHWKVCSYTGCTQKDAASEQAHSYVTAEITKRPTATEQGERLERCECGHIKTVKFNGVAGECDITSFYTVETNMQGVETSRTELSLNGGKYYHLRDDKAIYLTFNKQIDGIKLYYSLDGVNYLAVPAPSLDNTLPAVFSFNKESGACFIRLYNQSDEISFKAKIYVAQDSIAVEKQFTITPVPALATPKAYVYSESKFAYEWADIADTTIFVGQEYKIKALGYNVTAGGQSITLNEEGEGAFTPTTAGDYTVTIVSPYNANDSHTAKITVKEAVDTATLLSGNYAGGDYAVAFGEGNAITVSKEGADDIALTYTYEGGIFSTAGSDSVSIILTPTYKLFIVVGEEKTELKKQGVTDDRIYEILGGTTWKFNESTNGITYEFTVTFNANGTGTIAKVDNSWAAFGMVYSTTYAFTYSCTVIDSIYNLAFERQGEGVVDATNGGAGFSEIGGYATNVDKDNDFSYINNGSTVSSDGTSLNLNFNTGVKIFEKQS